MKKKVICAAIGMIAIVVFIVTVMMNLPEPQPALARENVKVSTGLVDKEYNWKCPDYEGYGGPQEWFNALKEKRAEFEGISAEVQELYAKYITDEEIARLDELEQACLKGHNLASLSEKETEINEIVDTIAARVPVSSGVSGSNTPYYSNGQWLTKSGGVFYGPSGKETYYSSNRAYHYRTGEWTVGDDGVYRDADGYVIVALPSGAMGTIVETSHGTGKCYDTNAGGDSVDLYVAW